MGLLYLHMKALRLITCVAIEWYHLNNEVIARKPQIQNLLKLAETPLFVKDFSLREPEQLCQKQEVVCDLFNTID